MRPMTDGESLLAAVIAAPEDDAIRLVYADWLEEHGDEVGRARAEFIRTQIALESLRPRDPKRAMLKARASELLSLHAEAWLRPLPEWARPKMTGQFIADEFDWFGFRRGFVQGLVFPGVDAFLSDARATFAAEPITHLYLDDANALPRLGACREFLGLAGLRFGHYTLGDSGAVLFTRLPPMPRLRQLWMYKNEIGDRGLKALARWPGLATVEDLDLGFNNFQAAGIKVLMNSPFVSNLKHLRLDSTIAQARTKKALKERFGKVVEL